VKASVRVTANTEIKVFMTFSPLLRDLFDSVACVLECVRPGKDISTALATT